MIVGECGISPSYFLDQMTVCEVELFLDGYKRRCVESWEQTRMIAYIIAQCNSTKKIKLTDIIRFDWDNKIDNTMNEEDIQRMKEKAKQMEDILNG